MAAILPGATLGILGGGQLGRMTGMAARTLGYDVHVLDPDPHCSARAIASHVITARFDDVAAAGALAHAADVVTLEIEQIAVSALQAAASAAPLRPGAAPIYIIQDRIRQKEWLAANGFPVGPFRAVQDERELKRAIHDLGRCVAKSAQGGYDGRGQVRLSQSSEAAAAWRALGARSCIVEGWLDLALELSVFVARRPNGDLVSYAPSRNHHTRGVLTWSVTPAVVQPSIEAEARAIATGIAETFALEGVLAVELFVTTDGRLLVNELAPRPHNTYHHSERAHATSQFEQLVRAACDLPLGDPSLVASGAIVNLLGDAWLHDTPPDMSAALAVPGARVHLYGKRDARAGRKMGHISAVGATPQDALDRAVQSYQRFSAANAAAFGLSGAAPRVTLP
ncbi:MAG: 5-(carboxyamino)imidazole ribonucleotide synthase [Gemmatimonadaceae bacterium]|jgi:5-(carboxyamino)imidazole ribonucleotide synthase|nr:5-(carboxyamino)imidazole ribonucleotide synthase [Gemmatimonadaceae bacterium]